MRILIFKGEYGYKNPEKFFGLICFIHIEKKDTIKIIEKISEELINF